MHACDPQNLVGVVYASIAGHYPSVLCRPCRLFALLRPGGRLLVTDYCTGEAPPSPGFQAYITQRGYKLVTLAAYGDYICDAGFQDVVAEDRTAQVQHSLAATVSVLVSLRILSKHDCDARLRHIS